MGNDLGAGGMVPRGYDDDMLREFTHYGGGGVPNIVLRGGMMYCGSRILLRNLGMASGIAMPLTIALTALDVAYVE